MADLEEYLQDVMTDLRQPYDARRLAEALYAQCQANLLPSPRRVKMLRRMLQVPRACGRLQPDGSCPWLRRNARSEGLRAPGPGEKIYCHRRASGPTQASFEGCGGYRRPRADADLDA